MNRALRATVWALLALVFACTESFEPASAVTNLRVVAAGVEIEGKPGRANPDPGDTITVTNLVVDGFDPDGQNDPLNPPELQWSLIACVPERTVSPLPICRNIISCDGCEATPPADPLALPIVTFTVPSAEELEAADATTVVLQGAICADGPPAGFDAILAFVSGESDTLDPCQDPDNEGRFISVQIIIEQDPDDPNLNPTIEDVTLDGEPWPGPFDEGVPRDAPGVGCAALVEALGFVPYRITAEPAIISLTATADSFQEITIDDAVVTEEMQVSWLSDGGAFEFSFSFITAPAVDATREERTAPIQWIAPSFPSPEGRLVRFTLPMRDLGTPVAGSGAPRGGVDWVQRGLCVVP